MTVTSESFADRVRSYAATRRLDARLVTRWLGWPPADAAALLDVAEGLGLGANQIGDFMTWLEEIGARDGTSPGEVLGTPEVRGLLRAPLGRGDKLKRLKAQVRARRFPRLAAAERALEAAVRDLALGDGVAVRKSGDQRRERVVGDRDQQQVRLAGDVEGVGQRDAVEKIVRPVLTLTADPGRRDHPVTGPTKSPIPAGISSTPSHRVPWIPNMPKSAATPVAGISQVCSVPSASQ